MDKSNRPDCAWTDEGLAELKRDFGDVYGGRTTVETGADGFMGSHLTEALVHVGEEAGYWSGRRVVSTPARYRPGASEVMALRVGFEKLNRETGWTPKVSWEEGILRTIEWYAANRDRWIGRVDWATAKNAPHFPRV